MSWTELLVAFVVFNIVWPIVGGAVVVYLERRARGGRDE